MHDLLYFSCKLCHELHLLAIKVEATPGNTNFARLPHQVLYSNELRVRPSSVSVGDCLWPTAIAGPAALRAASWWGRQRRTQGPLERTRAAPLPSTRRGVGGRGEGCEPAGGAVWHTPVLAMSGAQVPAGAAGGASTLCAGISFGPAVLWRRSNWAWSRG